MQNQVTEFYLAFMSFQDKKKMAVFFGIAIFFVVLDRFLKVLSLYYFQNREINLLGDFLRFGFIKNYYIALSIPLAGSLLTVVIALMILALIIYFVKLYKTNECYLAGIIMLIIAGAASNLFDRIKYGYVVDYLDLKWFFVFNLADSIIFLACCIIISLSLKNKNL